MAKKYKMIRVPEDVFEVWVKRKNKIQERLRAITKKQPNIALTNVLRYYGNRRVDIWDDELANYFNNNKKKRKFTGDLIWEVF